MKHLIRAGVLLFCLSTLTVPAVRAEDASAKSLERGFQSLSKDTPLSSHASSGRGIEAGLMEVELDSKEKAVRQVKQRKYREEARAAEEDKDMERRCHCYFNLCLTAVPTFKTWEEEDAYNDEMRRTKRARERANFEEGRVCHEWKEAGKKTDSAAFRARLRDIDQDIEHAQQDAQQAYRRMRDQIEAAQRKEQLAAQEISDREAREQEKWQRKVKDDAAAGAARRAQYCAANPECCDVNRSHKDYSCGVSR